MRVNVQDVTPQESQWSHTRLIINITVERGIGMTDTGVQFEVRVFCRWQLVYIHQCHC